MPKTMNAWSASRLFAMDPEFGGCEKRGEFEYILRVPFEHPKHLLRIFDRGTRMHYVGELILKGKIEDTEEALGKTVPGTNNDAGKITQKDVNDWWPWTDYLAGLKEDGAVAEEKWALTRDLKPTSFTNWREAWVRGITDSHLYGEESDTLYITDWKTGRIYRDKHRAQAEIYAWLGLHMFGPKVRNVQIEFVYLDQGPQSLPLGEHVFDSHDLEEVHDKYLAKGQWLTGLTKFKASPHPDKCGRCPFSKFKTMPDGKRGPCRYAVED